MSLQGAANEQVAVARLVGLAERLYDAVAMRDTATVRALLDSGLATSMPHDVREEALVVAALPASSYRVPMQLLRFHHRLLQLSSAHGDEAFRRMEERLEADADGADDGELGLEAGPADEPDAPPLPDPAQLEIPLRWDRSRGRRSRWRDRGAA